MLERILITFFCFIVATLTFIYSLRVSKTVHRYKLLKTVFSLFFIIQIFLMLALPPNFIIKTIQYSFALDLITILNGLAVYLLLFFSFSHLYFVIDRSISVRIMIEVEKNPDNGMTKNELDRYYNGEMIMERRLKHMLYGKFLIQKNDRYFNALKGKYFAKIFGFLKKYLRLGDGG